MFRRTTNQTLMAVAIALGCIHFAHADETFYTYIDKSGQKVITQTLSPNMAKRGYKIVTASGRVIREVKPALSDAEYAAKKAKEAQLKQQAAADKELLMRFRSINEIGVARERRLNELDYEITLAENSLEAFEEQLKEKTTLAANRERRQQAVSATLQRSIDTLQADIDDYTKRLKDLEDLTLKVSSEYDGYVQRYKYLKSRSSRQS